QRRARCDGPFCFLPEGVLSAEHQCFQVAMIAGRSQAVAVEIGAQRPLLRQPELPTDAPASAEAALLAGFEARRGAAHLGARIDHSRLAEDRRIGADRNAGEQRQVGAPTVGLAAAALKLAEVQQADLQTEDVAEPASGVKLERLVLVVALEACRTALVKLRLAEADARVAPEAALPRHARGVGWLRGELAIGWLRGGLRECRRCKREPGENGKKQEFHDRS